MKAIMAFLVVNVIGWLVIGSCNKTSPPGLPNGSGNPPQVPNPNLSPDTGALITTAGNPIGSPVNQNIGPGGGTVVSSDGVLHLIIPAGALSSSANISIQAVQNEVPGSFYNGYSLSPDGQQFLTPVSLEFHYQDKDLDTSGPSGLLAAYQSPNHEWIELENQILDTINKTVSFQTMHFTDYALLEGVRILPASAKVMTGQSITLTPQNRIGTPNADGFIIPTGWHNDNAVTGAIWEVNGAAGGTPDAGFIVSTGNGPAVYTAPSNVPSPGVVSVTYKRPFGVSNIVLYSHLKIVGNTLYEVDIVDVSLNYVQGIKYKDSASLYFTLNPGRVNTTFDITKDSIDNAEPYAYPPSADVDICHYEWQADAIGTVNVTSASASFSDMGNGSTLLTIRAVSSGGSVPLFKITCPNVDAKNQGGEPKPSETFVLPFIISDTTAPVQVMGDPNSGYIRITAKKLQ